MHTPENRLIMSQRAHHPKETSTHVSTQDGMKDENESRDVRESNLLQQSPSASSLSQENSFHSSSLLDIADSSEQSPTARRRNLRPRGTVVYGKKGQRVTRRIPQTRDSLLSQSMEGLQDDSVVAAGINTDNATCSQKIQSISCSPENDDTPDYTPQIQPVLAARKLELTISDIAKSLRNADSEANARRSGFNEASNHRHHILDATSRRKQRSRQKRRNSLDCSSSLAFVSLEEHEAGLELLKSSFDKSKRATWKNFEIRNSSLPRDVPNETSSRASSFAPPEQGKPVSAANGPEIREEVSSNHVIDPRSDPPKTATTVLSESLHIRLRSLLSLPGSDISTRNPLMNSSRARPRGKSYNLKSIARSSNDSRLDITPTLHRFPTNFEGLDGQVVINEMNE